ncbi:MAG: ABC transporter permease [Thermoanaerobaculia bacterium]
MRAFLSTYGAEMARLTLQHVVIVLVAVLVATVAGVPAGIWATRNRIAGRVILRFADLMQTIPSLAMFGFLIPLPLIGGIGTRTAIVALVLYSLLPIVRNTAIGIQQVDPVVREAGVAMGMTDGQILRQLELPLATPTLVAGLRIATVIAVGVATIAAAIGGGGLGVLIFRGVAMVDTPLILAGALPAALLAFVADLGFSALERMLARRRGESGDGVRLGRSENLVKT